MSGSTQQRGGQEEEVRERALAAADAQMQAAKVAFTRAVIACMKGEVNADQQVHRALQEVDRARAALREASDAA
jgi:hypothetical protein